MKLIVITFCTLFATTTSAQTCADLCDQGFLETATPSAIQQVVDAGTDLTATDATGKTALHWTGFQPARLTSDDIAQKVSILIEAGADIEAPSIDGLRPLHSAVLYGSAQNVSALLDAGANAMGLDDDGSTSLHSAQTEKTACEVASSKIAI